MVLTDSITFVVPKKNCAIFYSCSFYYLLVTDEIGKRKKSGYRDLSFNFDPLSKYINILM